MMKFHVVDGAFQPCRVNDCSMEHSYPATDAQVRRLLSRTAPYRKWNKKMVDLSAKHEDLAYGRRERVDSASFQILNFMSFRPHLAFNRYQLDMIQNKLAEKVSGDVIQLVNKTDQRGLERYSFKWAGQVYYGLPELTFTSRHIGKRKILVSNEDLAENEITIRNNMLDYATGDFEIGHRDPRKPLTAENTVMQPYRINRSYKDYYIFDSNGLPKTPNPERFAEDPKRYYENESDLRILYEALKQMFEPESDSVSS